MSNIGVRALCLTILLENLTLPRMKLQVNSFLLKPSGADCNLSCRYCFYKEKGTLYPQTKTHRMSLSTLREIIKKTLRYGGKEVYYSWQGGEPTLMGLDFFKKVVEFQTRFASPGQKVGNSLQTNGILLEERWAPFLKKYKFLVGLSLDGPKKFHDLYRRFPSGKGSFEKVIKCAHLLFSSQVEFNILVLLNRENVKHPEEVYYFLREKGFRWLQFIPCVNLSPEGVPDEVSVDPIEYGRFLIRVFSCWREDSLFPGVSLRLFGEILRWYLTGEMFYCVFRERCGTYLVIEHTGDVFPCDFLVEERWKLGNLLEEDLPSLLKKRKFREFLKLKVNLSSRCLSCRWYKLCHGGCPLHRIRGENYLCSAYQIFFRETENIFRELAFSLKKDNLPPPLYLS